MNNQLRTGVVAPIQGIKHQSAMTILAELGSDLSFFRTASNLTGWAGLRAGNDQSAGHTNGEGSCTGKIFEGNPGAMCMGNISCQGF